MFKKAASTVEVQCAMDKCRLWRPTVGTSPDKIRFRVERGGDLAGKETDNSAIGRVLLHAKP